MVVLFAATMFVSAALLFLVQPMFAKMVLPLAGGTPAVWNTCVLFFQLTLLAGYAYAHATFRWLGVRRQAAVHVALLLVPLAVLPIGIRPGWFPPAGASPVPWLLGALAVSVGLPFLAVSTTAPTLQRWFAATAHRSAGDPYFLYAASNLGSILALVLYPVVVEPRLRLGHQASAWTAGYAVFALLTVAAAVIVWRRPPAAGDLPPDPVAAAPARTVGWRRRGHWLALAAAPSSLMLGVTMFLSTDIAPMPLLWVLPLSLYLLTFVIAFSPRLGRLRSAAATLMPMLVVPLALLLITDTTGPLWLVVPLHLVTFFIVALTCHGVLADDRPAPRHLTEYYLWMALGGVLGGLFNTLVAPAVFSIVAEYPLVLVAATLLRPATDHAPPASRQRWLDGAVPVGLGLLSLAAILGAKHYGASQSWRIATLGGVLVIAFLLSRRPLRFGLGLATVMAVGFLTWGDPTIVEHRERTFFGVYQVELDQDQRLRTLMNGTTMHGVESLDPVRQLEPLSYYHRSGPIGQVFSDFEDRLDGARIAVVGLGTGTLAAYAQAGQHWTFYEVDAAVARISDDRRYFSYLPACGARCQVVLGDARVSLGRAPPGTYGLIVLDAFSSDAIPLHLMTREAFALYMSRLRPDGLLAVHVSNRHLDLMPVVGRLARDLDLAAISRTEDVSDEESGEGFSGSDWVVVARAATDLEPLASDARWTWLDGHDGPDWTDDFTNILAVRSWK